MSKSPKKNNTSPLLLYLLDIEGKSVQKSNIVQNVLFKKRFSGLIRMWARFGMCYIVLSIQGGKKQDYIIGGTFPFNIFLHVWKADMSHCSLQPNKKQGQRCEYILEGLK